MGLSRATFLIVMVEDIATKPFESDSTGRVSGLTARFLH